MQRIQDQAYNDIWSHDAFSDHVGKAHELDELGRPRERARWTPLMRILRSGEVVHEKRQELSLKGRMDRWMINKGNKRVFAFVFMFSHALIFALACVNYAMKDNLQGSRTTFGFTYVIARAAALVLHVDAGIILFPVCRTLISLLRQTPLNGIMDLDKSVSLHVATAWSMVFWSWVHVVAHWNNFAQLAVKNKMGFKGWLMLNFSTGPGWTGYVMLVALMGITATSIERFRRANYERFWYTHHLLVVFFLFWAIHGVFCMIQPDTPPYCVGIGASAVGVFWQYWMYGGFVYLAERIAREVRGRDKTYITRVIQHPSNVCEIQMKKEKKKKMMTTRAGQYIFFCCPAVSLWQYHPFTLTSAPEEDHLSIHMRCQGDFTKAVSTLLGCEWDDTKGGRLGASASASAGSSRVVLGDSESETQSRFERRADGSSSTRNILPSICIDGPFGSASEDVFKYEVAVLVGAGIGVTPFASILKSIWFRMHYPRQRKSWLRKVYFFWVCRDFGSFEWFRSLLSAIESQDVDSRIEIHIYMTAKIAPDDAANIMIHGADADDEDGGDDVRDAVTGLRSPTNFGRPNWDMIFRGVRRLHAPCEVGVFFCGSEGLGSELQMCCHRYTEPGFTLIWKKENF